MSHRVGRNGAEIEKLGIGLVDFECIVLFYWSIGKKQQAP